MPRAHTLIQRLSFGVLAVIISTYSLALTAQENDEELKDLRYENWYEIEVVVFDRRYSNTGNNAEVWPNSIELFYPNDIAFLFSEEEWQTLNELELESSVDKPIDTLTADTATPQEITQEITQESNISPADDPSNEIDTLTNADDPNQLEAALPPEPPALPELETERIKLPSEKRALNSEAKRIASRPDFKILFHEAWRQEFQSDKQGQHILITGGEKIDKHFELEGSIKLSLSRYLHLETNLWRVRYQPNYGQETPYWPQLPTLPLPALTSDPLSISESTEGLVVDNTTNSIDALGNITPATDLNISNNTLFQGNDTLNGFDAPTDETNSAFNFSNSSDASFNLDQVISFNDGSSIDSANIVSEIITFKQKRRMRSSELHYIDHPYLGLLIKITPYEVLLPQTEELELNQTVDTTP